jgi:hypothetical protein
MVGNWGAGYLRTWFSLSVLALALHMGCESDDRNVQLTTPGTVVRTLDPDSPMGGSGETESDASPPLGEGQVPGLQGEAAGIIGAACQQATECATGNCVDGVCCDSPCTDLCAACNVAGSEGLCSATPSDPLCPEANCQGQSSECRALGGGQATANCEAVGLCRADAECAALPAAEGTPCQQGTGTCDGLGACLVPDKNALGLPCEVDGDCAEAHCVANGADGTRVCCDAACDGVCQACSPLGRCEDAPSTDPRCETVACPVDNVCRDYVDAITDDLCRSLGQCRSALDCVTPEFFTGLRPNAQCVCDPASGDCALGAGTSCEQDAECASGTCVQTVRGDRLCCSDRCAAGLFCQSTGTGCVQCEGAQIECNGNVQRTCSAGTVVTTTCANGCSPGTGCNGLPPVGFLCDLGQCAPGAVCQQDTAGQARCCVRNCASEGKVCSASGSCECPPGQVAAGSACLLQPGDPCQNGAQCRGGVCVDGVCCQEACGGYCERCQAGSGLCGAVPAGQQETDLVSGNSCNNGFECTGTRNDCRARTGQSCSSDDGSDCVSGSCEPTSGGTLICCSQACTGVRNSCRSNGQGCVECESAAECSNGCNIVQGTCNPLRAPGETCSVAGQCSTSRCVPAADGNFSRCCPNCAPGQLCTAQGQCISDLSAPGATCGSNDDCQSGVCTGGFCCAGGPCTAPCATCQAGTGACIDAPARTPCGAAGSHQRCFNGDCALPTVLCGGINQQVTTTSACCEILGDAAGLRESFTTRASCPASGLEDGGLTTTPISCDEVADCPLGERCCHRSALDSAIECTAEAQCSGPAENNRLVCSSPQGVVTSCEVGTCGEYFLGPAFVAGWGFCG